jgi:hypothetical protein
MIFYGWRKKTLFLSDLQMQSCGRCNTPGALRLFVNYTSVHLYWIFGVVTGKKYIAQCTACRGEAIVQKHEVSHLITNNPNPVPFMDRWGLAVLVGAGCAIVAAYTVAH